MAVVKAVIDTNIWVSSLLNPFGFPARLRTSFEDGDFNIVISVSMLEELANVLNRPKIKDKFKIEEVPIIFTDRTLGESKMSGAIIREAVIGVIMLRIRKIFNRL